MVKLRDIQGHHWILLEMINSFGKIAVTKLITKSIAILYFKEKHSEKEIRETIASSKGRRKKGIKNIH